jgi:RNA polymerase sigma-70 factor (ECF subfamily)
VDPEEFNSERESMLSQATRGDGDAVARLLEEYLPRVRAFIRLRMGDGLRARESSSDLVQAVCVDLLHRQENFEYRGEAEFRSWLFQAALNKVRERQRFWLSDKRDVRRDHVDRPSADTVRLSEVYKTFGTPSRQMMVDEHMQRLERAFDQLPEHYQQVVTLARIVGLPHEQIARQIGKTVGATRQILGRALIQLADLIDDKTRD